MLLFRIVSILVTGVLSGILAYMLNSPDIWDLGNVVCWFMAIFCLTRLKTAPIVCLLYSLLILTIQNKEHSELSYYGFYIHANLITAILWLIFFLLIKFKEKIKDFNTHAGVSAMIWICASWVFKTVLAYNDASAWTFFLGEIPLVIGLIWEIRQQYKKHLKS